VSSSWKNRYLLWLLGLVLLAASLASRSPVRWWQQDESLSRIQRKGVLRAGFALSPQYAALDARGQPDGLAVDDIKAVAASLGVERVEWIQTSYAQLIPDLLDHRFDVVSLQLVMTPERERKVAFSVPALSVRYGVMVARGNPRHVPAYARLDPRSGLHIAVQQGAPTIGELRDRGFSPEQLVFATEGESGAASVRAGAAHALVRTEPSLRRIIQNHPGEFELVEDQDASGRPWLKMGYAFRLEDRALKRGWDDVLRQMGKTRDEAR
jgi:polar amino acid transport system substrate-binding protein